MLTIDGVYRRWFLVNFADFRIRIKQKRFLKYVLRVLTAAMQARIGCKYNKLCVEKQENIQ